MDRIDQIYALRHALSRRRFLSYAGLGSLGVMAAACAPTAPAPVETPVNGAPAFEPTTMRVGSVEGLFENANWMTGKAAGLYEEFGIDFEAQLFRDGGTVTRSVLAGDSDLADSGVAAAIIAIYGGADMRIIGTSRPGMNLVVYAQPDIQSVHDLEGRSVGTAAPGSFLHLIMLAIFQLERVNADLVNFVDIGASPDIFRALVAGTVDAGPAPVDLLPVAEQEGIVPLVNTWEALPDFVRVGFYATTEAIRNKHEELARVLAGSARTNRYVVTPEAREQWLQFAIEELGAEREQAEFSWDFQAENPIIDPNLTFTEAQSEFTQEMNILAGGQERILPFDEIADMSVRERALELVGEV